MRSRTSMAIAALTFGLLMASATNALADEPKTVDIDVRDAPLVDVIIQMSLLTGDNIVILDPELRDHKITFYTPGPVPIEEACEMLITTLELSGLHIEKGPTYVGIKN